MRYRVEFRHIEKVGDFNGKDKIGTHGSDGYKKQLWSTSHTEDFL